MDTTKKILIALVVVLAILAGYFGWKYYNLERINSIVAFDATGESGDVSLGVEDEIRTVSGVIDEISDETIKIVNIIEGEKIEDEYFLVNITMYQTPNDEGRYVDMDKSELKTDDEVLIELIGETNSAERVIKL